MTLTLRPLVISSVLLLPSTALAQTAPATGATQAPPARPAPMQETPPAPVPIDPVTGRPLPVPPPPTAMETAEQAAARMFLGGGSLMQAQLAGPPAMAGETPGAVDARTSFFAVPEPVPTLIRAHDLVTVIVREESASKTSGKTDLEKEASLDAMLEEYVRLDLSNFTAEGRDSGLRLAAEAESEFQGSGTADRKDSFVARITAEVLDVKPNGTLVLQAKKRVVVDEEEQVFVLTGTCRTLDITADNTVLSTQLHDLNLEKHTEGAVSDATKRGFLPRLLGKLNPF